MKVKFERKIIASFVIMMVLLFIATFFSVINNRRFLAINEQFESTNLLMQNVENMLLQSQEIVAGCEGYAKSKNEDVLKNYRKSQSNLNESNIVLTLFAKKHPAFSEEIDSVFSNTNLLNKLCDKVINLKIKNRKVEALKMSFSQNIEYLMKKISKQVFESEKKGRMQLRVLEQHQEQLATRAITINYLLSAAGLLIILSTFILLQLEFKKNKQATGEIKYLASLVDNVLDAIFSTDDKFIIKSWNKAATEIYGFTEQEAIGKAVSALLKISISDENINTTLKELQKQGFYKDEYKAIKKNGEPVYILSSVNVLRSEANITGYVAVHRDITERKKLEEQLFEFNLELEEKIKIKTNELSHIFERITDAFIALDNEWCFTYVNKKAGELYNRNPESLIGKNVWTEFPGGINEEFYMACSDALIKQKYIYLESFYQPWKVWFENHIYPSANGLSIFFRDVTEEKNSEEEMRMVHQRLSLHLTNSPLAIIEWDKNFIVTNWSKRATTIFEWEAEEVMGKNFNEFNLVFKDDEEAVLPIANQLMSGTLERVKSENRCYTKSGKIIYCEWHSSVLKNENGEVVSIMSLVQDVTSRRNAEAQIIIEKELSDSIINSLPGIFYVNDITGLLLRWNKNFETVTGYSQAELKTMGARDFFGADELEFANKMKEVTFSKGATDFEANIVTKDKTKIPHYLTGRKVIYHGAPALLGVGIDITDRKKAEEEATKAYKEKETVLNRINDGMVSVDNEWRYTFLNAAALTTHPMGREGAVGKVIWDIHPEMKGTMFWDKYHEAMQTRKVIEIESHYASMDTWFFVKIYPSSDGLTIFYNDISARKKAEQQIINEKELSDSIINSLPGVFYLYGENRKFLRWNKNFETVSGYNHDEVSKMHPLDFFEGENKTVLKERIEKVFESGNAEVEAEFVNKDGKSIPYYFNGQLVNYENKRCLIGVGIDITERIRVEEELRKSELQYRSLIEQASDPIMITDFNGNFYDVNESLCRLFGYSKNELLGMNIRSLIDPEQLKVRPMSFKELEAGQHVFNERRMMCKDGTIVEVEANVKKINDDMVLAIARNITDRKKAERQLIESEKKYRLLFQNNPMPMWMFAIPSFNIIDVNESAIIHYGYTRSQFLNMNAIDLRPGEEEERFKKSASIEHQQGTQYRGVWKHKIADGSIIMAEIITHDIIYNGEPARIVLSNDITQKLKAEEELKASHNQLTHLNSHLQTIREDERTRIALEIHDELGQQLTGLKMDAFWIAKKVSVAAADKVVVDKITNMMELIDDTIRTIRRISSDLRPAILDDFGLVAALEWHSSEFEKRTGIKCTFKSQSVIEGISNDKVTGIFRMYQEALTNVARHSQATEVNAEIVSNDGNIILIVKDNGQGFDMNKVKNKRTLGLLGMNERAKMFDGELIMQSEPGKGTVITIKIPIVAPEKELLL